MERPAKIGILNVSDRASAGVYEDTPGRSCLALLREWIATPFEADYKVVPDDRAVIEAEILAAKQAAGELIRRITGVEASLSARAGSSAPGTAVGSGSDLF